MGVPCQCTDPVSGLGPELFECPGKLAAALMRVTVGIAVNRPFDCASHDLGIAVITVGMYQ